MLAYGYIKDNWQQAVDLYTRQCSIGVNAKDLAMMAATLADGGKNPVTGKQVMDAAKVPGVLAVMATAGLYDDSGKWLYHDRAARQERRRRRHHRRVARQVRHRRRLAAARRRRQQHPRAAGDCRHLERARRQPVRGTTALALQLCENCCFLSLEVRVMLKRALAMAAMAVLVTAGPAAAQKVEVSGLFGWTLSDGVESDPVLAGDGNLYDTVDLKDSASWGLAVGFNATDNVEVGFLFGQQMSSLEISGTATREVGDVNINTYHPYVAYNGGAPDARVRPVLPDRLRRHQLQQRRVHPRQRSGRRDGQRDAVLHHVGRWA